MWERLRGLTPARIGLGRSGGSLPTPHWLDFRLAHARARDAVQAVFEPEPILEQVRALGFESLDLASRAGDIETYLRRPDQGRRLSRDSRAALSGAVPEPPPELALCVADGLSARAVAVQAPTLLAVLLPELARRAWRLGPVCTVRHGRVAVQDEIGQLLCATLALILIGERPGLGCADSLGAYLVHTPRVGNTDERRNCVSNIRAQGLHPERAALELVDLLDEARRRGLSGVGLRLPGLPGSAAGRVS
ncbi:MAG: ethanolamine ammonia-lyase subunit EutC [Proteobacteria bacterium]|nr:ethanolamine ammonia-lyase subunit EutC [Pseudomonadota bacterium]